MINSGSKCSSLIDSLHQDDIKDACPNKYMTGTCSKPYLTQRWETNNSSAFIEPSCCSAVNNYMLWPIYIAGIFTLLMITAALVAIAFNIYLSDKSEYLEFEKKVSAMPGIIFAALVIIALIVFAFIWFFKDSYGAPRTNPSNPDVIYSKYTNNIKDFNDDDFEVVNLEKVYKGKIPYEVYL